MNFLHELDSFNKRVKPVIQSSGFSEEQTKAILLKISNLLVGKFQYLNKHSVLLASPFGLIVDPSNKCHLQCPGCVHSKAVQAAGNLDWPSGLLDENLFLKFIRSFGPYATGINFYNWGEPFLNKKTVSFISLAKEYMLQTIVSSNLSLPIDPVSIVKSGLDHLTVSLDGATAETYSRYRRGGDFDLVVDNVRKLVAAKRLLGSLTPFICWQFLTFKHNVDEIDLAKKIAEEIGVDMIHFVKPYDVSFGDPTIELCDTPEERVPFHRTDIDTILACGKVNNLSADITSMYDIGWFEKFKSNELLYNQKVEKRDSCPWLYMNIAMDAHGRILPCCLPVNKEGGSTYVFSDLSKDEECDCYNTTCYQNSRSGSVNSHTLKPVCYQCSIKKTSTPNFSELHLSLYLPRYCFASINSNSARLKKIVNFLADWDIDWGGYC